MVLNKAKALVHNGVGHIRAYLGATLVWELVTKIIKTIVGYPINIENCTGEPLVGYKIYGNCKQEQLPDQYVELKYIESTGTQYIDTGYRPTINTSIETVFSTKATTSDKNLFGSRLAGSKEDYTVWINTSSGKGIAMHFPTTSVNAVDTKWIYTDDVTDTPTKLIITPETITVQDEVCYTFNVSRTDYTPSVNAYIFAQNENGIAKNIGSFRVYSFKIWDNGVLVRDMIPCRRISDGEVGMFDVVNNVFYENAGVGSFDYEKILPDGYVRLDYIESTGTQWINTGFCPNPKTTRVETTFQVTSIAQANQRLFGVRATANDATRMCHIFWNASSGVSALRLDWVGATDRRGAKQSLNTDIELICENNTVTENGTVYGSTTNKNNSYLAWPLYIGTLPTNGDLASSNPPAPSRWKIFKIYDEGTLVRDFVPCINQDGEAGLYDLVEGKFYGNDGTGEFVAGEVVADEPSVVYKNTVEVQQLGDECTVDYMDYDDMFDKIKPYNLYFSVYDMQLKPNTSYIVSSNVPNNDTETAFIITDSSTTPTTSEWGLRNARAFTTGNDGILRIFARIAQGSAQPGLISNKNTFTGGTWWIKVQRNQYKIPVKIVCDNLTSPQNVEPICYTIYLDEPLRKVGEYADYIDFETKKVIRNIGFMLLNDSNNYTPISDCFATNATAGAMDETRLPVVSNSFSYDGGDNHYVGLAFLNGGKFYIYLPHDVLTEADAKEYMSQYSAEMYYPLKERIITDIDLPTLETFIGSNIITVDTALEPSGMSVSFYSDSD